MVLKATFYVPRKVGDADKMVFALLSIHTLDLQNLFFKMTMCHNSKIVLCEENNFNPFTKLWHKVFGFLVLNHKLSKFIKLA
jgi:hypothetical protein